MTLCMHSLSLCHQSICKSCPRIHLQIPPRGTTSHHPTTGYLQGPPPHPWIIPTAPHLAPAAALSSLQPRGQEASLHLSSKPLNGSAPLSSQGPPSGPQGSTGSLIASQSSLPPSSSPLTVIRTAWLPRQEGPESFVLVAASAKNAVLQTSTQLTPSPSSQQGLPNYRHPRSRYLLSLLSACLTT